MMVLAKGHHMMMMMMMIWIPYQIPFSSSKAASDPRHHDNCYNHRWQRWEAAIRMRCLPQDKNDVTPFICATEAGLEPPPLNLRKLTVPLLHELDVAHLESWKGAYWTLGSGAFATVHMGRLTNGGGCVVVKRFDDTSSRSIEHEIRIHRYIEDALPGTPRLLGLLPSSRDFRQVSLVYELVPDSHTLHFWLKTPLLSTLHWLSVALQMAVALETLHRNCVLHNDLHSSNVLISFHEVGSRLPDCGILRFEKTGEEPPHGTREIRSLGNAGVKVKVKDATLPLPRVTFIDFGHATFRDGKVYTGSEKSLQSCFHLAPEVIRKERTSTASDVFSLGHELERIADIVNSPALLALTRRCTQSDPNLRPSVAAVVRIVRAFFLAECLRVGVRCGEDGHSSGGGGSEDGKGRDDLPAGSRSPSPVVPHSVLQTLLEPSLSLAAAKRSPGGNGRQPTTTGGTKASEQSTGHCLQGELHRRLASLRLPFLPRTGDLWVKNGEDDYAALYETDDVVVFEGLFESSGEAVAVKQIKGNRDYRRVQYEAVINLYLNQTGWVPRFHGVVPLHRSRFHRLGIVHEFLPQGVSMADALQSGSPVGFARRVNLALELTSLVHDAHSRHLLINNLREDNIACGHANATDCSDVKLLDVSRASGCEGDFMVFADDDEDEDDEGDKDEGHQPFLAPEVRDGDPTSVASDVYSLCLLLDSVLSQRALAAEPARRRKRVRQFLVKWAALSFRCFSQDPADRPSTSWLKRFFERHQAQL